MLFHNLDLCSLEPDLHSDSSTNDRIVCGQQKGVPNYQDVAGVKLSSNSSLFNFQANIKVVIHRKIFWKQYIGSLAGYLM